ncbi:hypothetical protein GGI19_000515 [Coemansia pectinata]|uniref:ribonuclease T2 n=1 Tax=Coemansia pectinata TaxID=1052879 RepID=A0A9W8LC46_9FUNG|nr:hypothetical protein GGI19_000515 [Coemansia pectinata]
MHGLWPSTCSGQQTAANGCDVSRSYNNISAIISESNYTLFNEMNEYWGSYNGNNNEFWSHEWTKHGTCVSTLDPKCYDEPYEQHERVCEYFGAALALRSKYNLYAALEAKGIVPVDKSKQMYSSSEVKDAIKSELGLDVVLKCRRGVLSEVRAWFHVIGGVGAVYVATSAFDKDSCVQFEYPRKAHDDMVAKTFD